MIKEWILVAIMSGNPAVSNTLFTQDECSDRIISGQKIGIKSLCVHSKFPGLQISYNPETKGTENSYHKKENK